MAAPLESPSRARLSGAGAVRAHPSPQEERQHPGAGGVPREIIPRHPPGHGMGADGQEGKGTQGILSMRVNGEHLGCEQRLIQGW